MAMIISLVTDYLVGIWAVGETLSTDDTLEVQHDSQDGSVRAAVVVVPAVAVDHAGYWKHGRFRQRRMFQQGLQEEVNHRIWTPRKQGL